MRNKNIDNEIFGIAFPAIISNITIPLLGLADLAISGHAGGASWISIVAVATMLFNTIYWLCGFLRMGTSGLTAQAFGAKNKDEVTNVLLRSLVVAAGISLIVLLIHKPLISYSLELIAPNKDIYTQAEVYCNICIWALPAVLGFYSLSGWFVGMQDTKSPMIIAIFQNVVNIILSVLFVFQFNMNVEGLALGTTLAQYCGLLLSWIILKKKYHKLQLQVRRKELFQKEKFMKFFHVNKDIFFRTLFMVAVNMYFLYAGVAQGKVIVAVNALLMQFYLLFSYIMDGFAFAAEALSGKLYGAQKFNELRKMIMRLFVWGGVVTLIFTIVYMCGASEIMRLLTSDESVINNSRYFISWTFLIPIAGAGAFIWDGIYIGLTQTKSMLITTFLASSTFFIIYFALRSVSENNVLWLAFILFLATRSVIQTIIYRVNIVKNIY